MIQGLFKKLYSSFFGWLGVCLGFCKKHHNHLQDWPEPKKKQDQKRRNAAILRECILTSSAIPTPFATRRYSKKTSWPKLQSDSSCHTGHDPFVKLLLLPAFRIQGRIHHAELAFQSTMNYSSFHFTPAHISNPFGWFMILLGLRNTLQHYGQFYHDSDQKWAYKQS